MRAGASGGGRGFTLIELMIVIMILAVVMAIAIPNLLAARKNSNEAAAIGHLKAIAAAQTLFREADKDNDGNYHFGTLAQLRSTNLVDPNLGTGVRTGYLMTTNPGTLNPSFVWFATANPAAPGTTGDRYFCINHRGQIWYTTSAAIPTNTTDCEIPPGLQLVR